ncbi:hypothetical protein ACFORL_07585 [Legionella dresdenensis]|uniref:N-acetyltransferase domain-containing protein n=1 Tax=Legionella dresdenensis TaxID=450200 RepID=A0ABV8CFJ9_9GAMM
MNAPTISRTEIITARSDLLNDSLLSGLERFVRQHYFIQDQQAYQEQILGIGQEGDLALYYDCHGQLLGFTRFNRQRLYVNNRWATIYTGGTYHDKHCNLGNANAKFGLAHAVKQRLSNPSEDIFYFAHAYSPERYQFLCSLSDTVYPYPDETVPETVLNLVEQVKTANNWLSNPNHPMVITSPMPLIPLDDTKAMSNNTLTDYYYSVNPDYQNGDLLLVYLELELSTISDSIKRMVCQQPTHNQDRQ